MIRRMSFLRPSSFLRHLRRVQFDVCDRNKVEHMNSAATLWFAGHVPCDCRPPGLFQKKTAPPWGRHRCFRVEWQVSNCAFPGSAVAKRHLMSGDVVLFTSLIWLGSLVVFSVATRTTLLLSLRQVFSSGNYMNSAINRPKTWLKLVCFLVKQLCCDQSSCYNITNYR